jgi:NADH-quinone oxidoreductase subunit J
VIVYPVLILVLCVAAGIGTVLALPSRREGAVAKIGGALLLLSGLILFAVLVRYAAHSLGGQMGVYFWIFTAIVLFSAIRVITHPVPVYSALYFVMTVLASAGLFVLLWAEFLAVALVLIYAGAILITYVFVIMLASSASAGGQTGSKAGLTECDTVSREPIVASAVGFALMGVLLFLIFDKAPALLAKHTATASVVYSAYSTQMLGHYLFKHQLINLELAGVILTISMVGAILIARRQIVGEGEIIEEGEPETVLGPATPVNDNPHSIPVYGTDNPRQKEYPET